MYERIPKILESIGLPEGDLFKIFEGVDPALMVPMTFDQVGATIQAVVPDLLQTEQARDLAHIISSQAEAIERGYAAAVATYAAEKNLRPNNSVTLYASDCDEELVACRPYDLFPRKGGVLQEEPFLFTNTMSFDRLMTAPEDCANLYSFVGGSFGFVDDAAKAMPFDVNFTAFRPEVETKDTPLASLQKASPVSNVNFTASVYWDGPDGETKPFYGVTLIYTDVACASMSQRWLETMRMIDWSGITSYVFDRMRASMPSPRLARPTGFLSRFGGALRSLRG